MPPTTTPKIVYRSECNAVGANLLVTTTMEAGITPGRYPGAISVVESGTGTSVLYHKVRPIPRHGGMRYETPNGQLVLEVLHL